MANDLLMWQFDKCKNCKAYKLDDQCVNKENQNKFFTCKYKKNCLNSVEDKYYTNCVREELSKHPYEIYREKVIDELYKLVKIYEITKHYPYASYDTFEYVLHCPCDFQYSIGFESLDNMRDKYPPHILAEQIAEDLKYDFGEYFLNKCKE